MLTDEAIRTLIGAVGAKVRDAAEMPKLSPEVTEKAAEAVRALKVVHRFIVDDPADRIPEPRSEAEHVQALRMTEGLNGYGSDK